MGRTGRCLAIVIIVFIAIPAEAHVFGDGDLQRLTTLLNRAKQIDLDAAKNWTGQFDCRMQFLYETANFVTVLDAIQEITKLSTKMVDSLDEETVLASFHQQSLDFLSYVEKVRKLGNAHTCHEVAQSRQRLLDLMRDTAGVVRAMEGRLIGLAESHPQ